jgi:hypothetical protein
MELQNGGVGTGKFSENLQESSQVSVHTENLHIPDWEEENHKDIMTLVTFNRHHRR